MQIGILGAGAMAQAAARHAVNAGHQVMLSNSRGPEALATLCTQLNCIAGTPQQAADFGEIVFVALPLRAYKASPPKELSGKIVLDFLNYFPVRDGNIPELMRGEITTSERLAQHLPTSRLVKALNAITAEDLAADARPSGSPERRAIPIAGNDQEAKAAVIQLLDQMGFDAADAGVLAEGWRFERFRPVYCIAMDRLTLETTLTNTKRSSTVPDGLWLKQRFPTKVRT